MLLLHDHFVGLRSISQIKVYNLLGQPLRSAQDSSRSRIVAPAARYAHRLRYDPKLSHIGLQGLYSRQVLEVTGSLLGMPSSFHQICCESRRLACSESGATRCIVLVLHSPFQVRVRVMELSWNAAPKGRRRPRLNFCWPAPRQALPAETLVVTAGMIVVSFPPRFGTAGVVGWRHPLGDCVLRASRCHRALHELARWAGLRSRRLGLSILWQGGRCRLGGEQMVLQRA